MPGLISCHEPGALTLAGGNCLLVLDRPHVVGILNVTPDSFSDGGRYFHFCPSVHQKAH